MQAYRVVESSIEMRGGDISRLTETYFSPRDCRVDHLKSFIEIGKATYSILN